MADSPTIVVARLDDQELQKSIKSMVDTFNESLNGMKTHADSVVEAINASLKGIKGGSVSSGGSSEDGSTKRTKAYSEEGKQIEQNVERQKEYNATLDQTAAIIQKAAGGKKKGIEYMTVPSGVDKELTYLIDINDKVGRQLGDAMQKEQALLDAKNREVAISQEAAQAQQQVTNAVSGTAIAYGDVHKMAEQALGIKHNADGSKQKQTSEVQYLREQLAALLDVEQREVTLTNTKQASYNELSAELKQLTAAYHRLGADIAKTEGADIAQRIQTIQREMQKFQQTMSRPVSWEAVNSLPTNTLDDIAYKLRQLQAYKGGLNLETQKNEIREVDKAYDSLRRAQLSYMTDAQKMTGINAALGRSWNYMKNRLAFYLTVGAGVSFVKQLVDIRGQYELLDRSIGILIDSAQRGSQIFAELNAMAIKSPFTTMELGAAAKQLVAYDVAAKDVVDTTRRLADMAAAVGIPIERLTYALGQIKSYGYLNSRDARMFSNAGIPLVKQLADYYTELEGRMVSVGDVYDRIKKKTIDYADVMQVVNHMTDEGGKFFNFQEKAADTLKVRIANLTLAWNNMLNEIGKDSQGFLSSGLGAAKELFENWRSINNMIAAAATTYGLFKAIEISVLILTQKQITATRMLAILQKTLGHSIAAKMANMGSLFMSMISPMQLANVAIGAFSFALIKATYDYYDLQKANTEFNKTIAKNADENINSINKFFDEYKKQLSSVASLNNSDQIKLWERVQEEIEKTTKNAEEYIRTLNEISDVSARIAAGESVLEQSKVIEQEVKRLAEMGTFNLGGGFYDDQLADNLIETTKYANELIKKYGTLSEAQSKLGNVSYANAFRSYRTSLAETNVELDNFVSKLDNANIALVMGDGSVKQRLANIRAFSNEIRDNFLATERGQQISSDGQARLNKALDEWIAKQGVANGLITEEQAAIEANKTAWTKFFEQLNKQDKERLDYLIATNQTGSKAFQDIWDRAAENMAKSATSSYDLIQQQIAELRKTPDIVVNVVYKNDKEQLDKDQEEFQRKYIRPKGYGALDADEYLDQQKANREKYGTLMRKQGEDTVEYEKRISDERKTQLELQKKNADIIEENKNKTDAFSIAVTEQAKKEKQAADERLKVIKEVEDAGGYDFSTKQDRKDAKAAESELQKALKEELSLIENVRSIYKDLTKDGASHAAAVKRATSGWNETVNAIDKVLAKNGLQKLDLTKFAGISNPRELVNMLQSQLDALVRRGAKPAEIKELQTKIQTLNVDVDKYDLDKITKGLNSELDKLKEEYELAVALDADPELGNVFASYFGIDTEKLPHDFEQVAKLAQERISKVLQENHHEGTAIDVESLLSKESFDKWVKDSGQELDSELVKQLEAFREYLHKTQVDEIKSQEEAWKKLLEKYAEYEYKIKKIHEKAEEERKVARAKNAGQDIIDAINKRERQELARAHFEKFKESYEWVAATGDLTGLTDKALRGLIKTLNEYKNTAKDLDAKQIKQINNALKSLYRAQREGNPFASILNLLDEASDRINDMPQEVQDAMQEIQRIRDNARKRTNDENDDGLYGYALTREEEERIKELQKITSPYEEYLKVDISKIAQAWGVVIGAIKEANSVLDEFFGTMTGDKYRNVTKDIQDLIGAFEKAAKASEIGANIGKTIGQMFSSNDEKGQKLADTISKIGGAWGAAIGAAIGFATGMIQMFNQLDQEIVNKAIEGSQAKAQKYQNQIDRLKLSVDELSDAQERLNRVMGYGLSMDMKDNYKQQLLLLKAQKRETERQIELEKSRLGKYYDEKAIADLEGQLVSLDGTIAELERSIKNTVSDITDDLLGISRGSWADELTKSLIDSFRQGEKYMDVFEKSWDDMINNMIATVVSEKVVGFAMEKYLLSPLDTAIEEIENNAHAEKARLEEFKKRVEQGILTPQNMNESGVYDEYVQSAIKQLGLWEAYQNSQYKRVIKEITYPGRDGQWHTTTQEMTEIDREGRKKFFEQYGETIKNYILGGIDSLIDDAALQESTAWITAVKDIVTNTDIKDKVKDSVGLLDDILADFGVKFGDQKKTQLSALSQGISSISEETANSIEAYLNGVSQQVYLHSTLLTQIRDVMVQFDPEVSMGIQSQMLLQLQQSYQVQMSIESILQGVLNPSGRAFAVEIIS